MSKVMRDPVEKESVPVLTWYQVWWKVYRRPSIKTFSYILSDPTAGPKRAILWLGVGCFINIISLGWTGWIEGDTYTLPILSILHNILDTLIPLFAVQWIVLRIGGVGSFNEYLYAYSAVEVPSLIFRSIFIPMPVFAAGLFLIYLVMFYSQLLFIFAVRSVYGFSFAKSAVVYIAAFAASIFIIWLFKQSFG